MIEQTRRGGSSRNIYSSHLKSRSSSRSGAFFSERKSKKTQNDFIDASKFFSLLTNFRNLMETWLADETSSMPLGKNRMEVRRLRTKKQ